MLRVITRNFGGNNTRNVTGNYANTNANIQQSVYSVYKKDTNKKIGETKEKWAVFGPSRTDFFAKPEPEPKSKISSRNSTKNMRAN